MILVKSLTLVSLEAESHLGMPSSKSKVMPFCFLFWFAWVVEVLTKRSDAVINICSKIGFPELQFSSHVKEGQKLPLCYSFRSDEIYPKIWNCLRQFKGTKEARPQERPGTTIKPSGSWAKFPHFFLLLSGVCTSLVYTDWLSWPTGSQNKEK